MGLGYSQDSNPSTSTKIPIAEFLVCFLIYSITHFFCNIYAQKNPAAFSETLLKCLTVNGFIVLKLDDATRSLIKEYFSLGESRSVISSL